MEGENVLIVGGGPSGLAMAIALARQSIRARIIDRGPGQSQQSRALGIQARTLEIFDQWGIADKFLERGLRMEGVNLYREDGELLFNLDFEGLGSRYDYLLSIPQSETEQILLDHAASIGLTVERNTELISLTSGPGPVQSEIRGPAGIERNEYAFVVGCDGAHSKVRESTGIEFQGSEYPGHFALADVTMDWPLTHNEAHIYTSPDGLLAIFPLPNGWFRIIANLKEQGYSEAESGPAQIFNGSGEGPEMHEMEQILEERGPAGAHIVKMGWSARFYIHSRLVSSMQDNALFLVGDAAHIHSPALAQGMNTGIQDATNLAWKLALVLKGTAAESLLSSYTEERMPVERGVLNQTLFVTNVMGGQNRFLAAVRDAFGPAILNMEAAQRAIRGLVSELSISYASSAIVSHKGTHDSLKPGDRAPDSLIRIGQSSMRLYEALREPGHHLLVGMPAEIGGLNRELSAEIRPIPAWMAPDSEYKEGRFYLIRPDGYLGATGDVAEVEEVLADYAQKLHFRAAVAPPVIRAQAL